MADIVKVTSSPAVTIFVKVDVDADDRTGSLVSITDTIVESLAVLPDISSTVSSTSQSTTVL